MGRPHPGLLEQVSAAERKVTARLRQASATWVKSVIFTLGGLTFLISVIATYLVSRANHDQWDVAILVPISGIMVVLTAVCASPIATVAEVFEFDVLHSLNNPMVLKSA